MIHGVSTGESVGWKIKKTKPMEQWEGLDEQSWDGFHKYTCGKTVPLAPPLALGHSAS